VKLFSGIKDAASKAGVDVRINRVASMGSLYFTSTEVRDFQGAKSSDAQRFKIYYRRMIQEGIYLAPSPFEAMFVSAAHDDEMIEKTINAAAAALGSL